jgi:hypothetical protein
MLISLLEYEPPAAAAAFIFRELFEWDALNS